MSKLNKKTKKILATAFAAAAVSAVGAGFALQSINANAAAQITVIEIRDWNLEADNDITIITDMHGNARWDVDINALELAHENAAFHPHLTINGYRSTVDGAYYFEEYNYAPLHLWTYMFGGPHLGYPSATVGYIGYLYDVLGTYLGKMGFVDSFPADTVVVCDGPVGNFLGETEAGAPYTAQWVNKTWQKVNSITLSSKPTKTTYQIGESIDMSGAKIKIDYASIEDREFAYADSITNCDVIGFDTTTPGDKTAYVNYHGQVFAFNYTVEASKTDVMASGLAYSADVNNHYLTLGLVSETAIADGDYTSDLAANITVGNTAVSNISGAVVSVVDSQLVIAIPKSAYAVTAGMAVSGTDKKFANDSLTLKVFNVALPEAHTILAWTLNYAVADGVQTITIAGTESYVGNGYAGDIVSVKDKFVAGDKRLSEIDGANITANGNVITVTIPKSSYDLNGKVFGLSEQVYLPGLNRIDPFAFPVKNDQMSSSILEAGTWMDTTRSVFFSFNVYDYDNYADPGVDFGWGYSIFNYAIEMNGETNLYHWADGTESIVNFMGFGGAGGVNRGYTTYNLLGWSYKTDGNGTMLGGEENWFNFPEGTILKIKKGTIEFNTAKIYIDNDYFYELKGTTFVPITFELESAPTKTNYLVGEALDLSGLKAKISYADGSSKTVDIKADDMYTSVSGFENTMPGEKTVTVNYRGMEFAFNYTVEKMAGEIASTGMTYTTTADNHVFTVALNDTYDAGAIDALKAIKITCGDVVKAVSELNGATVACDGATPYANLVITVPKASLTLNGAFSVALENDVVLTTATEETTVKAFTENYAVSTLVITKAAVANNVITLTVNANVNTGVYADFSALLNAVKLGDKTLAELGATVSYASANTIAISVPASVEINDKDFVLENAVLLPSLDTLSAFGYVIFSNQLLNETSLSEVVVWGNDIKSMAIIFDVYTQDFTVDNALDLGTDNTVTNLVSVNGEKGIFTMMNGMTTKFYTYAFGALHLGRPANQYAYIFWNYQVDETGAIVFGHQVEFDLGTIVTFEKGIVKEGYVLDRSYTFQLVEVSVGTYTWKELKSVELTSAPSVEFYAVGEAMNLAGATITVTYADNSTQVVDLGNSASAVTVTGFGTTEVGDKTATMNYFGREFTFDYKVKDITGYAISAQPAKTTYKVGEELNLNGLKVDILFGEYSRSVEFGSRELPEGFTVEGFTATEPTDSLVLTIKYKDAVAGTITLVVEAPIVESIIVTAPTKVEYFVGDELDLTGGYLVPWLDIGKQGDAVDLTAEGVEISGYDKTIVGEQTITVSYNGQTDTFTVEVKAIVVTFAQAVAPTEAVYNKTKATLEIVGGGFTAYYNNGVEEVIEFLDERVTLSFDRNTTEETVEITAKFGDYSCKFTATVVVEIVEEPATNNNTSMFGCSASISAAMSLTVLLGGLAVAFVGKRKDEE